MFKKTIFQNTVNKHRTQNTDTEHRTQNTNTANFRSSITTQTFYVVNATFEMGCILAQVTLHTRRQKKMTKNASLSSSANGYLGAEILTLWLLKQ